MRRIALIFTMLIALAPAAFAQRIQMNFTHLESRADEIIDVTLDGKMLKLASAFLSKSEPEEAQIRLLVEGLNGIYVKSFTFTRDDQYSESDLQSVRSQIRPEWQRIVTVRSKKSENVEVYVIPGDTKPNGLVVIAAEPRELTIIQVLGPIDIDRLADLDGHLGIPDLEIERKKK